MSESIFIKQLIWCRLATTEQLVSNQGGKFLRKLWCCVGGRIYKRNLILSTELIT